MQKLGVLVHTWDPRIGEGKTRGSLGLLAGQPSSVGEFQTKERPFLKKNKVKVKTADISV